MDKNKNKHIPIQYIEGHAPFFGYEFIVNKNVLIPRFETEELVENTINYINKHFDNKNIKVLDLCTGSGCIGITLKKEIPNLEVTISDISKKALEVAKKNAENLNAKIKIIESDLFDKINEKYDIIISNPPYVKNDEDVQKIVKNNEPHIALYAGIDGLDYYKRILKDISKYINKKSLIVFEIGYLQGNEIKQIANENGFNNIVSKKDLSEKDRMIFIFNNL